MPQGEEFIDPRQDIQHEIAIGQVYEDVRSGDEKRIIHEDDSVVILRYEHDGRTRHTLESRGAFEENVGSERFTLTEPTSGSPRMPDDLDPVRSIARRKHDHYSKQGTRTARHKAEAFAEMYDEIDGLASGDTEPFDFESIRGIGAGTADNLRDAGIVTEMDVVRTDEEHLKSIGGMGNSNTQNLLEAVE